jgi:H+-transporting ATPase
MHMFSPAYGKSDRTETKDDSFANAVANGLSRLDAAWRLDQYGYNELPKMSTNPLLKFMSYFWGPIPCKIEAAAILSGLVQH